MVEFNKPYADRLIRKPELTKGDFVKDVNGNNIFMSILIDDEEYTHEEKSTYIKKITDKITTTDFSSDVMNQVNKKGDTALIIAARNSDKINSRRNTYGDDIVKMLIAAGADLDIQNKYEATALIYAVDAVVNGDNTTEIVKMLIDARADLDIQDEGGETALMNAGNTDVLRMLIDAGANLDIQDKNGATALMHIVENVGDTSTEETVKMLIDAGAKLNIKDKDRKTAYDYIPDDYIPDDSVRFDLRIVLSSSPRGADAADGGADAEALSALLSQRIRINITKEASFTDPITMEEENINICDYIEEDKDNIVIVYNNNEYFFTTRQIISTQKDDATVYPCVRASHAIIPHRENVISTKPLYDLKKIGFVYSHFCDMKRYFNNPDNQLFAIINTKQEYPSFVSDRIFSGRDRDVVSGLHCQEGQESKISYMIVAVPSTKDNPDTIQMRGKRNTRKRNTRKRNNRKRNTRKRNNRKQNTQTKK